MKPKKQEYKQRPRSNLEEYDLLLLGSGTGGKLISWTMAKAGMKIANIERKYVGGSCQNIACLPSKNVIQSAKVAMLAGLPYTALRDAIFTHPAMAEGGLITLFNNVAPASVSVAEEQVLHA